MKDKKKNRGFLELRITKQLFKTCYPLIDMTPHKETYCHQKKASSKKKQLSTILNGFCWT